MTDVLRTGGALRREHALALGLTDGDLAAAVARGELWRPRQGSYASTAARESRLQTIRQDVVGMPEARQADNRKGNALAGRYHLLRFTWRDVFDRAGYVIATAARVTS